MSGRKVAIVGGSRFVGAAIARAFVAAGDDVTLMNRGASPDDFGATVGRRRVDRHEPGALARAAAGAGGDAWDVVVDSTAYLPADSETAVAAFAGRCARFLHVSSGQVYLIRRDYRPPAREDEVGGALLPRPPEDDAEELSEWAYGIGKWGCEEILAAAFRERRFPSIRLRLPVVLGPGDPTGRLAVYVRHVDEGTPILARDGGRNVLRHVAAADVGRAALALAGPQGDALVGGAINVAQDETPTLADLIALIAELRGRPVPALVEVAAEDLRRRGLPLDVSPFSGRWCSQLDTGTAKRHLGWTPTPWRETVAAAVAAVPRPGDTLAPR